MVVIAGLPETAAELLLVGVARSLFEFGNKFRDVACCTGALCEDVKVVGHYAVGVHRVGVARGAAG